MCPVYRVVLISRCPDIKSSTGHIHGHVHTYAHIMCGCIYVHVYTLCCCCLVSGCACIMKVVSPHVKIVVLLALSVSFHSPGWPDARGCSRTGNRNSTRCCGDWRTRSCRVVRHQEAVLMTETTTYIVPLSGHLNSTSLQMYTCTVTIISIAHNIYQSLNNAQYVHVLLFDNNNHV